MNKELELNLINRVAMGDIFRRRARSTPDRTAIVEKRGSEKIRLTYKELNDQLNRFARGLRYLGLKKGDRVAGLCLNSYEYFIVAFGIAKGGFVWVPLNPGLNPKDIAWMINDTEAKVVVVDDQLIPVISRIKNEIKDVEYFISIPVPQKTHSNSFVDFHDFVKNHSSEEVEDVLIFDRDPWQIMYTSGATANPKGVVRSHLAAYIVSLANLAEIIIPSGFHNLAIMPFFHGAEQIFTFAAFHSGSKNVILRAFDPKGFLEAIQEEGITFTLVLPQMLRALIDFPDLDKYNISSLKKCMYAMTPMDQRTLEGCIKKMHGTDFFLGAGQTECLPTDYFKSEWQTIKRGNYWGEPLLTVDTAVMDDEGNILPSNQIGEIVWRSPYVMNEYFKNPEATEEVRKYGWHHSGDLGMYDEDGLLLFVDRKKDMIKSGGENVSSIKVERIILSQPGVESVAVVGLPHEQWGEAVTAFVVLDKKGAKITGDDIISLCKQNLGKHELPKKVVFVEGLPKTNTGKMEKFKIKDQYKNLYQGKL